MTAHPKHTDYWYTHGRALAIAVERARLTGERWRVESTDPFDNPWHASWRIVPAVPVELVAS